jgi:FixJ family two-component response regulator
MDHRQVFVAASNAEIRHSIAADLYKAGLEAIFFVDGRSMLHSIRREEPVCILLDHCMGERTTLEVLDLLRKEPCRVPVLILYADATIEFAVKAMKNGASDFVHISSCGQNLADHVYMAVESSLNKARTEFSQFAQIHLPRHRHLSVRELEVFGQILLGRTSKEIGQLLDLSPRTVDAHRASIRRKTGNRSWVELAVAFHGRRTAAA